MNITLLKLGGSLITDKSIAYHAEHDRIAEISKQIARALKAEPQMNLILGNGAGSYAHQSAQKYKTINGFTSDEGRYGACLVHHDAMKLNQILMESLLKEEIAAFSLQPSAMMISGSAVPHATFYIVDELMNKKITPVLYGDVIIDALSGATIYSTDTIFKLLAEYLNQKSHTLTIIHAGNYKGVRGESDEIVAKITPDSFSKILPFLTQADSTDVTGGMKLKVEEMLALAKQGITSHLLDGTQPDAIFQALRGVYSGTTISPS